MVKRFGQIITQKPTTSTVEKPSSCDKVDDKTDVEVEGEQMDLVDVPPLVQNTTHSTSIADEVVCE